MLAAPAAKRAKHTRVARANEKKHARIKGCLEEMETDLVPAYKIACALNVLHKTPKSLARELSSAVAIFFDFDDCHFVRAPVFISLAYANKLDDDALCAALAHAALAASALNSVSKLFEAAGLTAKLLKLKLEPAGPSALELVLAPPNPNHVILHMTPGGHEVDYVHYGTHDPESEPSKFLVPTENCHDPDDLAALIVQRAPRTPRA